MGLRMGLRYYRESWIAIGVSIALQVPDENSKMTHEYIYSEAATEGGDVVRVPYVPSVSDLLADDWAIYES